MKTLVVTPIQAEIDFFLQGCTEQGFQAEQLFDKRLTVVHFPELNLLVAKGGLGKAQFAVQTQYLLGKYTEVRLVICAGAAGALDKTLAVGDIVVSTETVEHDIHNNFGKPLLPRFYTHPVIVTSFRQVITDSAFGVYFGPIASGDEDVVDVSRGEAIQQRTGALAVAWEGAGGARAAQFSGVPFVEIRGITDGADYSAAADFEANLDRSLRNVAHFITEWASQSVRQSESKPVSREARAA